MPDQKITEVSIYSGKLSLDFVDLMVNKLLIAFPDMTKEFQGLLIERIKDNNFNNDRLFAAVNNVIDKFPYKKLNIADIINYDVKVKFYYYEEILGKVADGEDSFDNYVVIDAGIGKPVRVRKEDFLRYKFKEWKK